MKIYDKLWLVLNKKTPKRLPSYWSYIIPWIVVGAQMCFLVLFLGAIATSPPGVTKVEEVWIVGVILTTLVLGTGIIFFLLDRQWGYIDAIYSNRIRRWEAKKKELESK